ncbi:hypothetical protein F4678DRAFT_463089 [Xylaria arbuscula]|nr:hypothetical protein F4678DRAFT_463089 [Xylaria arbuscula]
MAWLESLKTAGALALSAVFLLARLLYMLSTPLRWPLYYIYASIVFLLSPIWVAFSFGLGAASYAINLMASLKIACATMIGVCAGFALHGTSSFLFVLLEIDTPTRQREPRGQQHQNSTHMYQSSFDEEGGKGYDEGSTSSPSWKRSDGRQNATTTGINPNDLFEKQWKIVRSPMHSRRRRKGLLGQTIHEESSESDFT